MTPRGLDRSLKGFGITSAELARHCRFTAGQIGSMRRQRQPHDEVRRALLLIRDCQRDQLFRRSRRARADAAWPADDARRETVKRVAAMLDEANEGWLADLLLRARPAQLAEVAAGVAVHALIRTYPEVWDALMEPGIACYRLADEWYNDIDNEFVWSPPAGSLYP